MKKESRTTYIGKPKSELLSVDDRLKNKITNVTKDLLHVHSLAADPQSIYYNPEVNQHLIDSLCELATAINILTK